MSIFKGNKFISKSWYKILKKKFSLNHNILYEPQKDYYKILNVSENAEFAEIKKSFYQLSIKYHPDKGGKEEDFKLINNAYEVLKSPEDKKIYDRLRTEYLDEINIKINKQENKSYNNTKRERTYANYAKYENSKNYSNNEYNQNFYTRDNQSNSTNKSYEYSEYKQTFREDKFHDDLFEQELKRRYKEAMEMIFKYVQHGNKNNSENMFDKFKINVKYTPPDKEIKFEDFKLNVNHKHHMENRKKMYEKVQNEQKKRRFLFFFPRKKTKIENDPFKIYNEMNNDEDYMNALKRDHSTIDDESLQSKFTFSVIAKVYNKKILTSFIFINFLLFCYIIKN